MKKTLIKLSSYAKAIEWFVIAKDPPRRGLKQSVFPISNDGLLRSSANTDGGLPRNDAFLLLLRNSIIAVAHRSLPVLLILAGCAGPEIAVNRRADFSRIDRVAVASFSGPGGDAAADMLAQALLLEGADVVERQRLDAVIREQQLSSSGTLDPATTKKIGKILGVDAIFMGTVINATPAQSYLVTSGEPGDINLNTVTPVNSSRLYPQGSMVGIPGSEVLTSAANVALISRLVEVETGSILWSARMTYEGLDAQAAMADVTKSFARSLIPLWPALHPAK